MSNDHKNQNQNQPKGKSSYAGAVDRATGATAAASDGEATDMETLPKEAKAMILKPTQEQINALMADTELEFAPQVYSLKLGEMVTAILEGQGPSTEFTQIDPMTRTEQTRVVDTWILRHPDSGFRVSILSSVQLDKKLPPFVGSLVTIYRGEDKKTAKNFRVTDYTVAGPKRADGQLRSWVQGPRVIETHAVETRTIDGHPDAPQLGAGAARGGEDVAA